MATPTPPTFDHLLNIINGTVPAPHTKFVSFRGALCPQQVEQLATALSGSSVQGGIRLKNCCLGDSGAQALAIALACNRQLETCELPGNEIGMPGTEALLACLQLNTTLTTLDLADNPCMEEASDFIEEIDAALNRNRQLPHSPRPTTPTMLPNRVTPPPVTYRAVPPLPLSGLKGSCTSARQVLQPSDKENLALSATTDGATSRFGLEGMTDLENRLQHLEGQYSHRNSSLGSLRAEMQRVVEWVQHSEGASEQVAEVLAAVQSELVDHRTVLQELGTFHGQMVTGKQDFEDKLVSMRHDWRCLEEDVSHLTVALSVGAKQVLEEAGAAVALQTQNMADQVRSDYTNALDRVWDKVDSLEAAHNALASRVGEEEQDLEGAEQGTEGAAHPALQVRVRALEEDSKSVHEHTAKLDRYIETMLRDMLGTLNQGNLAVAHTNSQQTGQEHLKADVRQLSDRLSTVQQHSQQADPAQATAVVKGLQRQLAEVQPAQGRLQQGMAEMLEDIADRFAVLEAGLTDANKFAEAERVRCEQSEAVIDSLLATRQLHSTALTDHTDTLVELAEGLGQHAHMLTQHTHGLAQHADELAEHSRLQSIVQRNVLMSPPRAALQLLLHQSGSQTSRARSHRSSLLPSPNRKEHEAHSQQQHLGHSRSGRTHQQPALDGTGDPLSCQHRRYLHQTSAESSSAGILMTNGFWQDDINQQAGNSQHSQSQAMANLAMQRQVQKQAAAIAVLQTQLSTVLQRAGIQVSHTPSVEMPAVNADTDRLSAAAANEFSDVSSRQGPGRLSARQPAASVSLKGRSASPDSHTASTSAAEDAQHQIPSLAKTLLDSDNAEALTVGDGNADTAGRRLDVGRPTEPGCTAHESNAVAQTTQPATASRTAHANNRRSVHGDGQDVLMVQTGRFRWFDGPYRFL